jgi:hypothetical protein
MSGKPLLQDTCTFDNDETGTELSPEHVLLSHSTNNMRCLQNRTWLVSQPIWDGAARQMNPVYSLPLGAIVFAKLRSAANPRRVRRRIESSCTSPQDQLHVKPMSTRKKVSVQVPPMPAPDYQSICYRTVHLAERARSSHATHKGPASNALLGVVVFFRDQKRGGNFSVVAPSQKREKEKGKRCFVL